MGLARCCIPLHRPAYPAFLQPVDLGAQRKVSQGEMYASEREQAWDSISQFSSSLNLQAKLPWPKESALLTTWDSHTLARGRRYTVTSDTYQLGKRMTRLLRGLPACSDEAWQCAEALACTAAQNRLSAAAILQHPWIAAQQSAG